MSPYKFYFYFYFIPLVFMFLVHSCFHIFIITVPSWLNILLLKQPFLEYAAISRITTVFDQDFQLIHWTPGCPFSDKPQMIA